MKTKIENPALILAAFNAGVESLLFPLALQKSIKPQETLDGFDDRLPGVREQHRQEVDVFIESIFSFNTPESLWRHIRKTDRTTSALYYDRILAARYSLEAVCRTKEVVQVPASWETLIRLLLTKKFFQ